MTRDFTVGILFLVALVLLGTLTFMEKGAPWGASEFKYRVSFDNVAGLVTGQEVRVRGLRVGKVQALDILDNSNRVLVDIVLWRDLPPREDYRIEVLPASTLGGRYLSYDPGISERLADLASLRGTGNDAEFFSYARGILAENRRSIRRAIRNLEEITAQAREGEGLLGVLLRDEDLATNVSTFADSLVNVAERVERGQGVVGALLSDDGIEASFRRVTRNVEEISYKVNHGEGPIGMLLNDQEISSSFRNITRGTETIVDEIQHGDGLVARLISDPTLAERMGTILDQLDSLFRDIREGPGLIPRLIRDPALAHTVDDMLTDVREITARINSAQGTLGKLIASDVLYREIQGVVRTIREATEDAREQAPINTFTGLLFAAF